jgi:ABC-2 type transport system permease protein
VKEGLRQARAELGVLFELRFLLAWRRLRGRHGVAEGLAHGVLVAMALPASLVVGSLIALGSFRAVRAGSGAHAGVAIAAILFGLWQAWTAVSLTMGERDGIRVERLLAYPLSPARLYLVGLAASMLADPFALFWLVLLSGMVVGAALARPGPWLLLLVATLGAFVVATATFIALAQELLARIARRRLWRDLAALAGVGAWVVIILSVSGALRGLTNFRSAVRHARFVLYPPAIAAEAVERLYASRPVQALPFVALLLVASALTGWLACRAALGTARSAGERARAMSPTRRRQRLLFPEGLGPLFEKEIRYLTRHPAVRIYLLVLPVLASLIGAKLPVPRGAGLAEVLRALPLFALAAYVHLAFQIFWVNGLGFERGGARTLYLAPIAPERILAAKNLALLVFTSGAFALSAAAYIAVAGPPPAWATAGAAVLQVGMAPLLYGLGNVLGMVVPRAATFGIQRSGSVSPLAALAAMAISSATLGLFGLPVLLAVYLEALWLVPVSWAVLAVCGGVAWRLTLPASGRLLVARREEILAAVCGDDV